MSPAFDKSEIANWVARRATGVRLFLQRELARLQGHQATAIHVQELEARILYDASPLAVLVSPEPSDAADLDSPQLDLSGSSPELGWDFGPLELLIPIDDAIVPEFTATPSELATPLDLVVIDSRVAGHEELLGELHLLQSAGQPLDVIVLDRQQDGIEQVSLHLQTLRNVRAIHFVSNANELGVELGNLLLTPETAGEHAAKFAQWSDSLASGASVLFYGCEFNSGQLAQLQQEAGYSDSSIPGSPGLEFSSEDHPNVAEQLTQLETLAQQLALHDLPPVEPDVEPGLFEPIEARPSPEIVFVDATLPESEALLALLRESDPARDLTIVQLQPGGDGIEQIARHLEQAERRYSAIHLLTHGTEAGIQLGQTWLNSNNLWESQAQLSRWTQGLTAQADLHVYGCEVASSSAGENWLVQLAGLLDLDVQASVNRTGAAELGGDWILEFRWGAFETESFQAPALAQWSHVLAVVTANADSGNAASNEATTINLISNDSDPDGDAVSVVDLTTPSNGSVVNNGNGTVTYTSTAGYTGNATFSYLAIDSGSNLTHYWGLNGNATDAVGGSNGTLNGTTTISGSFGGGLAFDQVDDYVALPDLTYSSNYSLSFKFKVSDLAGSNFQYIFAHGTVATANSLNIYIGETSSGTTNAHLLRTALLDADDASAPTSLDIDINSLVGDGQWHTYTLTVSATSGASVYLDGTLQITDATRGTGGLDPTGGAYLGSRNDFEAARFYGNQLDSVMIFGKSLLGSEISALQAGSNLGAVTMNVDLRPVVSATGGSLAYSENAGALAVDSGLTITDADDTQLTGARITISGNYVSGQDVLAFSNQSGITGSWDSGTGVLTLSGTATVAQYQTALQSVTYTNSSDSPDTSARTVSFLVNDGAFDSLSATRSLTITAVNDAPLLDNSGSMTLNSIDENTTASAGQTVASIIASAGGDRITDPDTGALEGVAITALASGNGTWQYSINAGGSWNNVGSVSSSSALLLRSTDYVRFVPNAITGTTASLTFRAWDQTSGSAGSNADTTSNGGTTAFSSSTETASLTVTDVNDEQVLTTNNGLTLSENSTAAVIGTGLLETTDVDHTPSQLLYSITIATANGTLRRSGTALGVGSTFSQADLDAGLITYDHAGGENSSDSFSFTVDDGQGSSTSGTFNISITPVNDNLPTITSNGGGPTGSTSLSENSTLVTTVTATDGDLPAPTLSYSLAGGADAALFTIDSSSGALSFLAAPDRENAADADGNHVYEVVVQVSDGSWTDSQSLSITVNDVDEFDVTVPSDSDGQSNAVDENAAAGTTVGISVVASDADATTNVVSYGLDDDAGGRFQIDATSGVVSVANGSLLDYETATSHSITVRATSADGSSATRNFTISLNPLNDQSPVIVTHGGGPTATINVQENTTTVATIVAVDGDLPGQTLTYSILGGADSAQFSIDSNTGVLTFLTAPDYESPTDANGDNQYEVTVQVSDGNGATDEQVLTINVQDLAVIADSQTVGTTNSDSLTLAHTSSGSDRLMLVAVSMANPGGNSVTDITYNGVALSWVGAAANASNEARVEIWALVAPDIGTHNLVVNWIGPNLTGAVVGIKTFTGVDQTTPLGTFSGASGDSSSPAVNVSSGNDELVFAAITVESASNYNLVPGSGQQEQWDLHDDDANSSASTKAGSASVTMDWSFGGSNQWAIGGISIRPTVSNNQPPAITSDGGGDSATIGLSEGAMVVTTVTAIDTDLPAQTLNYTIVGGDDAAAFSLDPLTGQLTFLAPPDYENPGDSNGDNQYEVVVQVSDGSGGSDLQSLVITVSDNDEFDVTAPLDVDLSADQVMENSATGTLVGITVTASDADATNNSVTYSLIDDAGGRFAIDALSGVVSVANGSLIDRESSSSYTLTVRATSADGSTADTLLTINVLDQDEFDVGLPLDADGTGNQVAENALAGTTVGITASASDGDATTNAISYQLLDDAGGRFAVDSLTGVIRVANGSLLDRESAATHQITLRAVSADGSFADSTWTISVQDVDEFDVTQPVDSDPQADSLAEDAAVGSTVGLTAFAADGDATTNAVVYSLDDDASGRFAVDALTGQVSLAGMIDYESATSHTIVVRATSADGSTSTRSFSIAITNVNESGVGPVSDSDPSPDSVNENAAAGTAVGVTAQASDPDSPDTVQYSLDDDAGGRFTIDATSGIVRVAGSLDRESASAYAIVVRATSSDGSFSTQSFSIGIQDVDEWDVGPISDSDTSANAVVENSAVGSSVGVVASASDDDATTSQITYSLSDDDGGRFAIDASTGVVRTAAILDRELDGPIRTVVIRATSADGSFSEQTVAIDVLDWDEFDVGSPLDQDLAADEVLENALAGVRVGITVGATDADSTNNQVSYSLIDDAGGRFEIDALSGEVRVAAGASLDREAASAYAITVRANSSDGSYQDSVFQVALIDQDEFDVAAPIDLDGSTNQIMENAPLGSAVGIQAAATDSDATNNTVLYSLEDDAGGRFAIDAFSGVVTVAGNLDFELSTQYSVRVRATSSDGSTATATWTIDVLPENDNSPTIVSDGGGNSATLLVGEHATLVTLVQASDGDLPATNLTYAIVGGADAGQFTIDSLTGRLEFNSARDFETPSDFNGDGTYEVLVQAFDGNFADYQLLSIVVTDENDLPFAADDSFSSAEDALLLGGDIRINDGDPDGDSLVLSLISGPTQAASFNLNADGTFSYRPAANFFGTDSFVYEVSDGKGGTAQATVTIDVQPVNDSPLSLPDLFSMLQGSSLTASTSVLGNDLDVENNPLVAILLTGPAYGSLSFRPDGTFDYSPTQGFIGTDSFVYVASDGSAASQPTLVQIAVDVGVGTSGSGGGSSGAIPNTISNQGSADDQEDESEETLDSESVSVISQGSGAPGQGGLDPAGQRKASAAHAGASSEGALQDTLVDLAAKLDLERQLMENATRIMNQLFHYLGHGADNEMGTAGFDLNGRPLKVIINLNKVWEQFASLEESLQQQPRSGLQIAGLGVDLGTVTLAASLGYVLWFLRGGALLATILTQLPTWKLVDPLVVMDSYAVSSGGAADDVAGFFDSSQSADCINK